MVAGVCLLAAPLAALAQTQKTSPITYSASISGFGQFKSDLDNEGGSVSFSAVIVSGSVESQLNSQWSAGFLASYTYEDWSFSSPAAFGNQAPWDSIHRTRVGASVNYRSSQDLAFFVSPQVEWDYETSADENGQSYGAVFGISKVYSPKLVLGLGVGIFRQIDETKYFPFLIVNWQIDDKWKLSNPYRAGPAGGAGLELVYTIDDNWEAAGGGAWRDYRFRLSDNAPAPDGIGQHRGVPLFARLTRKIGPKARLDLYGGATVAGQIKLRDSNGNQLVSSDYDPAPFIALTLAANF